MRKLVVLFISLGVIVTASMITYSEFKNISSGDFISGEHIQTTDEMFFVPTESKEPIYSAMKAKPAQGVQSVNDNFLIPNLGSNPVTPSVNSGALKPQTALPSQRSRSMKMNSEFDGFDKSGSASFYGTSTMVASSRGNNVSGLNAGNISGSAGTSVYGLSKSMSRSNRGGLAVTLDEGGGSVVLEEGQLPSLLQPANGPVGEGLLLLFLFASLFVLTKRKLFI